MIKTYEKFLRQTCAACDVLEHAEAKYQLDSRADYDYQIIKFRVNMLLCANCLADAIDGDYSSVIVEDIDGMAEKLDDALTSLLTDLFLAHYRASITTDIKALSDATDAVMEFQEYVRKDFSLYD